MELRTILPLIYYTYNNRNYARITYNTVAIVTIRTIIVITQELRTTLAIVTHFYEMQFCVSAVLAASRAALLLLVLTMAVRSKLKALREAFKENGKIY